MLKVVNDVFRRWLGNPRINVHRLYKPIIQAALANWEDPCVYVSVDATQFWDKYCLIRLAVVHRGRALPLAWRVLEHSSATVASGEYQELLTQAARYLPKGLKIILLADRGFVRTLLQLIASLSSPGIAEVTYISYVSWSPPD